MKTKPTSTKKATKEKSSKKDKTQLVTDADVKDLKAGSFKPVVRRIHHAAW